MARPRTARRVQGEAEAQAKAGGKTDMATRVMRRMQAVSRVALLIQTADALAPGPLRDQMAARVDRMMARLERTPL